MNKTNSYLLILALLVPIFFTVDVLFGSVSIPLQEFLEICKGNSSNSTWYTIITEIRIPRAAVALIVGIALPISGLLMQTFFRNPLAGPDVLGISTGASLGVALYSLAGGIGSIAVIDSIESLSSIGLVASAAIGSSIVMIIIASIAHKIYDTASLLIIGIMISSVTSAIVSVLQYFSSPNQIQEFLMWTFGSFSGIQGNEILIMISIIIPTLVVTFGMQKSLNAMLLGENYSRNLGVRIKRLRIGIVVCASLLAGIVTAFTGPIGFVGMSVPHIARMVFKTYDHKILILGSALIGANLLLLCDMISQMPGFEITLPINIITAIFGAPVVIFVIYNGRKSRIL